MGQPIQAWIQRTLAAHERADREEFARIRAMSQAERVAALQAACLTARRVLEAMSPEARARALAHRDPLPESSVRALKRLRKEAKWHASS